MHHLKIIHLLSVALKCLLPSSELSNGLWDLWARSSSSAGRLSSSGGGRAHTCLPAREIQSPRTNLALLPGARRAWKEASKELNIGGKISISVTVKKSKFGASLWLAGARASEKLIAGAVRQLSGHQRLWNKTLETFVALRGLCGVPLVADLQLSQAPPPEDCFHLLPEVNWASNLSLTGPSKTRRRAPHASDFSPKRCSWDSSRPKGLKHQRLAPPACVVPLSGVFYPCASCVCWPWPAECFIASSWRCEDLLCSI